MNRQCPWHEHTHYSRRHTLSSFYSMWHRWMLICLTLIKLKVMCVWMCSHSGKFPIVTPTWALQDPSAVNTYDNQMFGRLKWCVCVLWWTGGETAGIDSTLVRSKQWTFISYVSSSCPFSIINISWEDWMLIGQLWSPVSGPQAPVICEPMQAKTKTNLFF